jgi:hypothetical protein
MFNSFAPIRLQIFWSCIESFWKLARADLAGFQSLQICLNEQYSFEKPAAQRPATFESRPGLILPVLKSFRQIHKLLVLNS